jgi:hypothetical protein
MGAEDSESRCCVPTFTILGNHDLSVNIFNQEL